MAELWHVIKYMESFSKFQSYVENVKELLKYTNSVFNSLLIKIVVFTLKKIFYGIIYFTNISNAVNTFFKR